VAGVGPSPDADVAGDTPRVAGTAVLGGSSAASIKASICASQTLVCVCVDAGVRECVLVCLWVWRCLSVCLCGSRAHVCVRRKCRSVFEPGRLGTAPELLGIHFTGNSELKALGSQ
jgi:hypothetical protein